MHKKEELGKLFKEKTVIKIQLYVCFSIMCFFIQFIVEVSFRNNGTWLLQKSTVMFAGMDSGPLATSKVKNIWSM